MASVVPGPGQGPRPDGRDLGESLEGLVEFTGATAGWVGWRDAAGRLAFPARHGDFPDLWLTLQQGRAGAWGFAVREGPTLLNNLPPVPTLGEAPLRNLLSCPLDEADPGAGHVVLANKPNGFTSQDATVLLCVVHLMRRTLARAAHGGVAALPATLLGRVLDRLEDGVLVQEEGGQLVYANAAWLRWTGFRAEEVLGRPAPFPFWISDRDLPAAGAATTPGGLAFRRADQSLFWCHADSLAETWEGRRLTLVLLRPVHHTPAAVPEVGPAPTPPAPREPAAPPGAAIRVPSSPLALPRPEWLSLLVQPAREVGFWDERWERLTGLTTADLQGVRSEVVLDWLFPRQRDRELVGDLLHHPGRSGGQVLLEILTPAGNRLMLCTFLPTPGHPSSPLPGAAPADPRREQWLLLVAEPGTGVPVPPGSGVPDTVRADAPESTAGPHPVRKVTSNE